MYLLKRKIDVCYLFLAVVYWTCIFLISPLQETGFLDDFAYAQSVKQLVFEHKLFVSDWSSASLLFQIIYGYLFSLLFGFSFKSLHLSTITLLFFGISSFYLTLKFLKFDRTVSLLITLFLLSVPWYLFYGFSFSTDVPFASLQMIAVYFFTKGFIKRNNKDFLLSSIFIASSFLVRQLGIGILIAGVLTLIITAIKEKNITIKNFISFLFLPLLLFIAYSVWLSNGNNTVAQLLVSQRITNNLHPKLLFSDLNGLVQGYNLTFHRLVFYSYELLGFLAIFYIAIGLPLKLDILFNKKIFIKFLAALVVIVSIISFDIFFNFSRFGLYVPGVPVRYLKFETLFPIPWTHVWKLLVIIGILIVAYSISVYKELNHINAKFKGNVNENKPQKEILMFFILLCAVQLIMLTLPLEMYAEYVISLLSVWILIFSLTIYKQKLSTIFVALIVFLLLIDMIQINKLNYQINGRKWIEGMNFVKDGYDPNYIDIKNYAWPRWFVYDIWIKEEIQIAGNKKKVNNVYYGVTVPIKYVIFSEFDSVKDKGNLIKVINKNILFVNTTVSIGELY